MWIKTVCPLRVHSKELRKNIRENLNKIFRRIRQTVSGYCPGIRWWTQNRKSTNHLFISEANYSHSKKVLTEWALCYFFVGFQLQESRPLALNTHVKEQVNSNVCFTTLMFCHWKLFQIKFYNHNLTMSYFSVLYFQRQTIKNVICLWLIKSLQHLVEISRYKLILKIMQHFITGALGSKGTDWKETDMNKILSKLV